MLVWIWWRAIWHVGELPLRRNPLFRLLLFVDRHTNRCLAAIQRLLTYARAFRVNLLVMNLGHVNHLDWNVVVVYHFRVHLNLRVAFNFLINFCSIVAPLILQTKRSQCMIEFWLAAPFRHDDQVRLGPASHFFLAWIQPVTYDIRVVGALERECCLFAINLDRFLLLH